jgi:hypothetical protein
MRVGVVLAAVLLLAACAGAPQPSSTARPPSATPTASPPIATAPAASIAPSATPGVAASPGQSAGEGWRQLATGLWLDNPFTVDAAANDAQLEELWSSLLQEPPRPQVDFERELVLFLGMSGSSSCPERLVGLVVDHAAATVHGRWAAHDPNQACTDDLQAQGVLLAVDRSLLPGIPFILSLREQPICEECPEQTDRKLVDPAG